MPKTTPNKFINLKSRRTPSLSPLSGNLTPLANVPAVSIETVDGPREVRAGTLEVHPISVSEGNFPKKN